MATCFVAANGGLRAPHDTYNGPQRALIEDGGVTIVRSHLICDESGTILAGLGLFACEPN